MPKTRYNFSIDTEVLDMAKKLAKDENRPVSNLLETLIKQAYEAKKEGRDV